MGSHSPERSLSAPEPPASGSTAADRPPPDPRDFYDALASSYHLIYEDWAHEAVPRQGRVLDRVIRSLLGPPPLTVLDCTCGIGTQAIGLAMRGYTVHGTDISPGAVFRARQEAAGQGAIVTFGVADVRALADEVEGRFDIVLSCDNSLPHLISERDLRAAIDAIRRKTRDGGLILVGIRDYDQLVEERPVSTLPRPFGGPQGERITFQVWDWADDGRTYTLRQFILQERSEGWETRCFVTTYRAVLRDELTSYLRDAGCTDIRWHMPEETGHHQPIVTARPAS